MTNDRYILAADGQTPIAEPDLIKWATWFENFENRRVALDQIGPFKVSTVFLGMDPNFYFFEPTAPILWETMIFGGKGEFEGYQERYTSYEAAIRGHQAAVELAKSR